MKLALLLMNSALLALGNTAAPLLLRLYFILGGKRLWFSSWLETGGWPIMIIPLFISYFYRRRTTAHNTKLFFITPRLFIASAFLGILTGCDDYMYAYGSDYLPVSTSSLLISTQLMFNAIFAFLIVKHKFSSYSINSVFLLTLGAVVLGLHTSGDRPANESHLHYMLGFVMTIGAAALYGMVLPLIELTYMKATQEITYTLVVEMQMVMSFFATAFCTMGMLINHDFQAIPREASEYELGEVKYYVAVVSAAIMWQFFFLGMVGVISCSSSLHAGVLIAAFIPVTEVLAVFFFREKFGAEKGVSLALSLWGFGSYLYGEKKKMAKEKQNAKLVKETELA
ncbi:purine permease 1-like [Aristolochia californica]|uniref:purine permease 1-like n=1 Tax=Aristolochia californica TaxID=171875 RepID=UPI0035DDEE05